DFAASGLRVLGIARLNAAGAHAGELEALAFEFLGLVGLADPVRPDVPAAVAECRAAGVRVVMITGDHPETARAIARDAGI
ncbi:HAD family hydrolase, partial [Acinetobacter baumannii]